MNTNLVLFGILPLIAFVVIDSFLGLKAGLLSAILLAVIEALYTLYEFGSLDALSIASLAMVLGFALLSLKTKDPIYMKLQPVFLGVGFGVTLLIMQAMGKPLLLMMLDKYDILVPTEMRSALNTPMARAMLTAVSLNVGVGFLVHAGLVAYAAFRMSKWWWLFIRGIGVYVMMIICVLMARYI